MKLSLVYHRNVKFDINERHENIVDLFIVFNEYFLYLLQILS